MLQFPLLCSGGRTSGCSNCKAPRGDSVCVRIYKLSDSPRLGGEMQVRAGWS